MPAKSKMTEEEIYEAAKQKVEDKKGFRTHFIVYLCINAMLVIIWAITDFGGFPWFVFPLGGWGIGIVFHFLSVYVFSKEEDMKEIEKEAAKIRKQQR